MDTRFAISEYHDAKAINRELDELIKKPIYTSPILLRIMKKSTMARSARSLKR